MLSKPSSLKKYLGSCSFEDELIIFCISYKETETGGEDPDIDYEIKKQLKINNFSFDIPFGQSSGTLNIEPYVSEISIAIPVDSNTQTPLLINIPFNCDINSEEEIDLSNYYEEIMNNNIDVDKQFNVIELENKDDFALIRTMEDNDAVKFKILTPDPIHNYWNNILTEYKIWNETLLDAKTKNK